MPVEQNCDHAIVLKNGGFAQRSENRDLLHLTFLAAAGAGGAPERPLPSSATSAASPRTSRCDVGLVFAMSSESGGLVDRMQAVRTTRGAGFVVREGELAGRSLVILECGVGRAAASRGTEALLAGHRPALVISAGFAGGLQPQLKRGNFLLADKLIDEAGEQQSIDALDTAKSELLETARIHAGTLLTVDRIVAGVDEKAALGEKTGAAAVDMETFDVAAVCRAAAVPFLPVRIISDAVDEPLPRETERLARQRTMAGRLGAALGVVMRRPGSVKEFMRLRLNSIEMADHLAEFLEAFITAHVPPPDQEMPA